MGFFIRSAAALAVLYALSFALETTPVVSFLRAAMIGGIALAGVKMVLRYFGIATRPGRR
jgi:hypothetical protein